MAPVTFFDDKKSYAELELALTFIRTYKKLRGRLEEFRKIQPTSTKLQRLKHKKGEFGHNYWHSFLISVGANGLQVVLDNLCAHH